MSVKIQINSLEALERLIGNDTQLEIELRQSVAVAMTKKYVSALVDKQILKDVIAETQVQKQSNFGSDGLYYRVNLSDGIKEKIREYVQQQIGDSVREIVDSSITSNLLEPIVKRNVDYKVGDITNKILQEQVNEKVKEQIKAKFNI